MTGVKKDGVAIRYFCVGSSLKLSGTIVGHGRRTKRLKAHDLQREVEEDTVAAGLVVHVATVLLERLAMAGSSAVAKLLNAGDVKVAMEAALCGVTGGLQRRPAARSDVAKEVAIAVRPYICETPALEQVRACMWVCICPACLACCTSHSPARAPHRAGLRPSAGSGEPPRCRGDAAGRCWCAARPRTVAEAGRRFARVRRAGPAGRSSADPEDPGRRRTVGDVQERQGARGSARRYQDGSSGTAEDVRHLR